jgi:mRNA interferase MazF
MVIQQGDVFWVTMDEPSGSEPGYRHPFVIIQNNVFNASRINTSIGIALTSNLSRASIPGNVLLRKGEASLPKASVVNVTQIITLNKADLKEKIGSLSPTRVNEILAGLGLVTQPREI